MGMHGREFNGKKTYEIFIELLLVTFYETNLPIINPR